MSVLEKPSFSRRGFLLGGLGLAAGGAQAGAGRASDPGQILHWPEFASAYVAPRRISVYLPPGYGARKKPLPVIYFHDGQNLFDPALAGFGVEWGVDEALGRLAARRKPLSAIVVGVWNTKLRRQEYGPAGLVDRFSPEIQDQVRAFLGGPSLSDAYIRFLVEELRPRIESDFRAARTREKTFVMGSSMGGLISLEAALRRPDVFSAAACVSTHWPLRMDAPQGGEAGLLAWREGIGAGVRKYVRELAPKPGRSRFYFDHGSKGLDAFYAPFQALADSAFAEQGFRPGRNFQSRFYDGADHNEGSWAARVETPLQFLLSGAV